MTLRIAIATNTDDTLTKGHFGAVDQFVIYDLSPTESTRVGVVPNPFAGEHQHHSHRDDHAHEHSHAGRGHGVGGGLGHGGGGVGHGGGGQGKGRQIRSLLQHNGVQVLAARAFGRSLTRHLNHHPVVVLPKATLPEALLKMGEHLDEIEVALAAGPSRAALNLKN